MWSFVEKNIHHCLPAKLVAGDCWIALSLAQLNGLILCGRVGKHTGSLAQELVASTQGKTSCKQWVLMAGKDMDEFCQMKLTTTLVNSWHRDWSEPTAFYVNKPDGSHRRQNMRDCGRNPSPRNSRKFGKVWELSDSHLAFGHQLLQLDLGTIPFRYYCGVGVQT